LTKGGAQATTVTTMVNTFLTSWDLDECARSLDYKRLGKQRVEAYQIWRAINGHTKGWRNHPASRSWEGYSCALAMYTNAMIKEWVRRGYNNTMKFLPRCRNPKFPWWWGLEDVRLSHCASLNRKNPDFYHFELGEYVDNGYVWPSKIIATS
jgi:hypothetical protein